MKLLIITTYYPPDTAIAAVRPYMLAKYLRSLGHQITVLRSGEINKSCENFYEPLPNVRIISYLGGNSPAERYARGEEVLPRIGESRISFLPPKIRIPIAKAYHFLMQPKEFSDYLNQRNAHFETQKLALESLKEESFDLVFSTYGELENVFAGQYAAKLYGCKLIQDFRDSIAQTPFYGKKFARKLQELQKNAVSNADAYTAVSEGLLREISIHAQPKKSGMVLYNGYEPYEQENTPEEAETDFKGLTLCYTGQLYRGMSDISPLFSALSLLIKQNRIDPSLVKIHYAGANFEDAKSIADAQGLSELLIDHGYITKTEAANLQNLSDLFLVLSWNTATSQGILTGKFYEGIRAKKPILSIVSGDLPHSELDLLNEKYHYGFCYEISRKDAQFSQLCDFLYSAYTQKTEQGRVVYTPNPSLFTDFRYDTLAQKLESLCETLLDESKKDV